MYKLWHLILAGVIAAVSTYAETAPTPLPAVKDILQRVMVRAEQEQDNDKAFSAEYRFLRSKVTSYRNGQGELKAVETKVSTNKPAAVVAAVVNPAIITNAPKDPLAFDTHGKVNPHDFDKQNLIANPEILDRFDFKLIGRETTNGRATLVLDFQPKQKVLPEHSLKERFINKTAGRVWVDEADAVVMKADLRLVQPVEILDGVVGVVSKFTYWFARERTPDGLWYVCDTRWHLEGREVVLNRIIDCHESRTGVRKVIALVRR